MAVDSGGPGKCDTAAVEHHFAPEFLAQRPAAAVVQILETYDWLQTPELDIDEATPFELKASVLVDGVVRVELKAAVEDHEPHRLLGTMLRAPGPTILERSTVPSRSPESSPLPSASGSQPYSRRPRGRRHRRRCLSRRHA